MPNYVLAGSVGLSAGGSDDLVLKSPLDLNVQKIGINSTGRCEITDISITGQLDLFEGRSELHALKEYGNIFVLPEAQPIDRGQEFILKLRDISGAANEIYVTLFCVTR